MGNRALTKDGRYRAAPGTTRTAFRATSSVRVSVERDMESQMQHNLREGLLQREGEEHGRYSWRGMLFLWFQVLRDIFRLS